MNENTNETQPVAILDIDTMPELDAYHAGAGGVTRTTLYIYPDQREAAVRQTQNIGGMPPADQWQGLTLTYALDPRPDQDALRDYLHSDAAQALLATICDGHYTHWYGNKMWGYLNDAAEEASDALLAAIAELPESDWVLDADLELVSETMACPKCGERRVDWLACGDDENEDVVTCGTCGYVYELKFA